MRCTSSTRMVCSSVTLPRRMPSTYTTGKLGAGLRVVRPERRCSQWARYRWIA